MRVLAVALTLLAALTSSIVAQSVGGIPGRQEIAPAGAVCSDGSPWKFFVSAGNSKKVVVDFQGEGACWNGISRPDSRITGNRPDTPQHGKRSRAQRNQITFLPDLLKCTVQNMESRMFRRTWNPV